MPKVLLVDDDKDFVEVNRTLLEGNGYEVIFAYNPEDGMNLLETEKPEVMVLDVMMQEPDDGFAMAQKIRRNGNQIPIVMLSSISKVSGAKFEKNDEMLPVNEFLEKPVKADVLLAAIRKYHS